MSSIKEEQEREFSYIRKVSCIHIRKFPLALYKQHSTTQLVGHRNRHCNAFVPLSDGRVEERRTFCFLPTNGPRLFSRFLKQRTKLRTNLERERSESMAHHRPSARAAATAIIPASQSAREKGLTSFPPPVRKSRVDQLAITFSIKVQNARRPV